MNEKSTPDWLRLKEVIDRSGMSVNAFALHIGLPRSENLYQIKKGNHGISKALAEMINRYYPDFSVGWLLSGSDGFTLSDRNKIQLKHHTIRRIPVCHDLKELAAPLYQVYLSENLIKGSELVIINTDEAMSPRIPVGAMVFLKPAQNIISGKIYVVVTGEFVILRKVIVQEDNTIVLSSVNRENYADILLNRSEILSLYSMERVFSD